MKNKHPLKIKLKQKIVILLELMINRLIQKQMTMQKAHNQNFQKNKQSKVA